MSEKRFTFFYERGNEVVFEDNGKRLSNKQLVDLLNEQQDIIKSKDSLLSILSKENEQLREELSEWEKFRYSSFKRREKTIEDKNNCVFNKDAKYPCKAYDECLKRKGTNKPSPCMVNWVMGRPFENMIKKEGDYE